MAALLRARPLAAVRPGQWRVMSSLPKHSMLRRLAAIDGLQTSYSALENDMLKKQRKLEEELKAKAKVLFERRQAIVAGTSEPTEEEVAACNPELFSGREDEPPGGIEGSRGIPGFWKGALMGADLQVDGQEVVSSKDWAILESLEQIRIDKWTPAREEYDEPMRVEAGNGVQPPGDDDDLAFPYEEEGMGEGFALVFTFGPNEFFDTKQGGATEIALYCNGMGDVEEVLSPVWRHGKDPTVQVLTKKRKAKAGKGGKGKGGKAPVEERTTVTKPVNSFFRLFEMPHGDDAYGNDYGHDDDMENPDSMDDAAPVISAYSMQADLLMTIAEDVVPNAGAYYMRSLSGAEQGDDTDDPEYN